MEVAIFARTFPAASLEENLDAVEDSGIEFVHFNLKCAGLDSLPQELDPKKVEEIRHHFRIRDLKMVALSGTFNTIHPDSKKREEETRRCVHLIEEAPSLGTHVVTLCTGTRDPENMWRAHPENSDPEAWKDLMATLEKLLPTAEESGVVLGIEPELANVVDSAEKAKKLIEDCRSPALGIVLDGANLIRPEGLEQMPKTLHEAVETLRGNLLMAHAKDLPIRPGESQAAGKGSLDWESYFCALQSVGYEGPLVLHNLEPSEVSSSKEFVETLWQKCKQ